MNLWKITTRLSGSAYVVVEGDINEAIDRFKKCRPISTMIAAELLSNRVTLPEPEPVIFVEPPVEDSDQERLIPRQYESGDAKKFVAYPTNTQTTA